MPKPSRWTAEKRYQIVLEVLRGKESIAQIARRHKVSDALLHRWRERFFEGGKAALAFENGAADRQRGQQESGFDEAEVDRAGAELSDEAAVGPTWARRSAGQLRIEGQELPGIGFQIRDHFFFLRRHASPQ